MTDRAPRALLTGWFSFLHGEATAGDLLAAQSVGVSLRQAGMPYDTAWSPAFQPEGLRLEAADPVRYTHLVFACGPLHSRPPRPGVPAPVPELHRRYARCRRIAVGVSVPDPADPAVRGFHVVLPRDGPGLAPAPDLALGAPPQARLPMLGVVLALGQQEYAGRRRHERVAGEVTGWIRGLDAAVVALDTRLDTRDWRLAATAGQVEEVIRRLDAVVTTRLHGLVLALRAGVPAVAVDPVAGGAKVTAQAGALDWPAVLPAERAGDRGALDRALAWCLSADGRAAARRRAAAAPDGLAGRLREALDTPVSG